MDNMRKIDLSFMPMPEAFSYIGLLFFKHPTGFGWNTETKRIEYVLFDKDMEVNEKVAAYLEDKEQVLRDIEKMQAKVREAKSEAAGA